MTGFQDIAVAQIASKGARQLFKLLIFPNVHLLRTPSSTSQRRRGRRTLTSEQAREMVRVREARRAYRRFRELCFWSYDPDLIITGADVPWVVEMLRKHGNRQAGEVADTLCR